MSNTEHLLEKIVFGLRAPILLLMLVLTIFFGYQVYDIEVDSNLKKMVPLGHEYIRNFFRHRDDLSLGNDIRIAVENTRGEIFDREFLEILRQVSDEAFYLPGVDKGRMKSLWTANVRWSEVDVDGIRGGEVIPPQYDGSPEALEQVRQNVLKSDHLGVLVADDLRSAIVYLPLIEFDEDSRDPNKKIDYKLLSEQIETGIRERFETDDVKIHVIGFAKKIGDLIDAVKSVLVFFVAMLIITFHLLVLDSRCVRSAAVIVVGAVMAVVWQLGIVSLLRKAMLEFRQGDLWRALIEQYPTLEPIQFGIDPYSMLVPFLVFAISVSHGVQYTNEMMLRVARGDSTMDASRHTFRSLFVAGLLALLSDAIGFITLWFVDIGVIRELAITASVGVAVIIFTKLVFAPVVMSYIGVSPAAVRHRSQQVQKVFPLWQWMSHLTERPAALVSLLVALLLTAVGWHFRQDLQIGDLDAGAPELRPDSRYNRDNAFITTNYSVSADVLVVMVETAPMQCSGYPVLSRIDRFMGHMEDVEGVNSTASLVTVAKHVVTGFNEGNLKWSSVPQVPEILNGSMIYLPAGFTNVACTLVPVFVFLDDHRAATLERAVQAAESFARENDSDVARFVLASGSAGVEAATNQTIARAQLRILWLVYGVVALMVLLSFRSWQSVLCTMLPLVLTSVLCEGLMALRGIGVKVGTLPVIALGVGIGVDYGIYLYAKLMRFLAAGLALRDAYRETLRSTGRSIVLTCLTLSLSVGFWIFSGIKFQSDMGLLLTFMFLWNMIGSLWLLPAVACFVLRKQNDTRGASAPAITTIR
ncbi:MAG TPA: MMPL family transporter [Dongiaceae bacterium]|nr:MMPL family transporter [Dongiaceae bacterium]